MRFDLLFSRLPNSARFFVFALAWLILISAAHYYLNVAKTSRKIIRMGYMPVISNLAAPMLDHITRESGGVRFEAVKFASFAEMGEAIRNGYIQVAFMIAPLSIVLRQQGEDVKVVYIGNRHESTLVVSNKHPVVRFEDLSGLKVAVPMRYSGHYLCMRKMLDKHGMGGKVNIVEMNPPDMASAMMAGSLDAYLVGEPFAAQSVMAGHAKVLNYVEDMWPDFICNLMVVRGDFIDGDPETVRRLVHGAIRSGIWAARHVKEAAGITSGYWGQPVELVEYALTNPPGRIQYGHYTPVSGQMQEITGLMKKYGLIENETIDGLIDARFAEDVNLDGIAGLGSILGE